MIIIAMSVLPRVCVCLCQVDCSYQIAGDFDLIEIPFINACVSMCTPAFDLPIKSSRHSFDGQRLNRFNGSRVLDSRRFLGGFSDDSLTIRFKSGCRNLGKEDFGGKLIVLTFFVLISSRRRVAIPRHRSRREEISSH